MATSALTTATAAALTSTLPESASKSNQQSPRNTPNAAATVAVQTGQVEVSKVLQEGEKFIKWDEVSFMPRLCNQKERRGISPFVTLEGWMSYQIAQSLSHEESVENMMLNEEYFLCSLKYVAVTHVVLPFLIQCDYGS